MLVQDFLENSADRYPDKVALVCDGQRLTYAEIEAQANRLANALRRHGLQRGQRVVILMPNRMETVVAIFATLKAGGVFVVVNHSTKYQKLVYILNNCEASFLVTWNRRANWLEPLATDAPTLLGTIVTPDATAAPAGALSYSDIQTSFPAERPTQANIDRDLACLIYTSGSTGEPKGVMSDHSNVVFASGSIITYLENVADDIVINVLPLSFDYGLYQLLMVFRFGGTLVLEKGFAFPAAVLKRIEAERVTGFPGVPTLYALLLQMDLSSFDLSRLRYLTNTAAALPPAHILQLRDKFPGATLYSMYGLTETKRTLYLPPEQLDKRPGSVGIAIPGSEVWLVDGDGIRLGPGQTGELVVRGRHVMRGYWGAPEATAARYRPGPYPGEQVCYTGDLFRMDEEGYFYFMSRQDDIIKSRGEKVAPREIEDVLYALPDIKEAVVIGVPDPILGEAIKAFIAIEGDELTEAKVLAHCKANLEDYMVPQRVEIRDQLPKTSSGKLKRTGLS